MDDMTRKARSGYVTLSGLGQAPVPVEVVKDGASPHLIFWVGALAGIASFIYLACGKWRK